MSRQSSSDSTAITSRYDTGNGTSSHPRNEDWTNISNMADRRRVQNRIAQRTYRMKLKRRREHIERKTKLASASPQIPAGQPSPRFLPSQDKLSMEDDLTLETQLEREISRTPPLFAYAYHPYPQQLYRPVSHTVNQYGSYFTPVPFMMQFHQGIKRKDDTMSPFNMSDPGFLETNPIVFHRYEDSNLHTPPSYSCEPSTITQSQAYHTSLANMRN